MTEYELSLIKLEAIKISNFILNKDRLLDAPTSEMQSKQIEEILSLANKITDFILR